MIVLDFETRSACPIQTQGSGKYAQHESTEVLCLAHKTNDGPIKLWTRGDRFPVELRVAINNRDVLVAHNAMFERLIWQHVCVERMDWPAVPPELWRCTAARCARLALPRSLEGAGAALGMSVQKDQAGHRHMLKMCKPRRGKGGGWHEGAADLQRLYDYCIQDVATQYELAMTVPELTESELKIWQLDQEINLRGLPIDLEGVEHALEIIEQDYRECCDIIQGLTDNAVRTPKQVGAIMDWIKGQDVEIPSLSKEDVAEALERDDLPAPVRAVLEVRQRAGKASTMKLKAFQQRTEADGRLRHNLRYHGAATGRWAGSGLQIQNFPRGSLKPEQIELVHKLLPQRSGRLLDTVIDAPPDCISSSLRSFIRATPGHKLYVCDFASIEARVLAWVAGEDELLQTFRSGGDVYVTMAASIYDVPVEEVTKEQRSIGKMSILGLGYGMGAMNFVAACKAMAGIDIELDFAESVVQKYRKTNANIVALWRDSDRAIKESTIEGKARADAGHGDPNWLHVGLPSGRDLHYRTPRIISVPAPWSLGWEGEMKAPADPDQWIKKAQGVGVKIIKTDDPAVLRIIRIPLHSRKAFVDLKPPKYFVRKLEKQMIDQVEYWGVDGMSRKWRPTRGYGGKWVENIVQAIARDLLVEAMLRVEQKGYRIIATVHDEVICEVPDGHGSLDEFNRTMSLVPEWAAGCPVDVEGYVAERYRK